MRIALLILASLLIGHGLLPAPQASGAARPPLEETSVLGSPVAVTPIVRPSDEPTEQEPAPTTGQPAPAQATQPLLPTPRADALPDRCEPNDARSAACALALDAVNGPYTFLPAGDQDWYRLELPASGLQTTISVRATAGLDLAVSVSRDNGAPLAAFASPAISTTLAADVSGGVIVRVENRDPAVAEGQSYGIEVRQVLPPAPAAVAEDAAPAPDALEDNWSPATAAPIGVGVVYELSFVCPVPWGCPGGDHDYLRVPVKAGVPYLIATFDLGPGVDTVLDLFWGDEAQPVATNDDTRPGAAFLSVLRWVAPADGEAILRVGPRTGGLLPAVTDDAANTYRLAVALAHSDLARQLEERIAQQAQLPTATAVRPPAPAVPAPVAAAPAAAAPAAAPPAPASPAPVSTDAPTGTAVVRVEATALREGPSPTAAEILSLPAEAVVTLLGQSSGAWVRVQPVDSVLPGWVRGADLALRPVTTGSPSPTSPASASGAAPGSTPATATPTPLVPRVERLDPLPPPLPTPPAPQQSITFDVQVVAVSPGRAAEPGRPLPTPRPDQARSLAAVRVQLVDAFGDVLAEALTGTSGTVRLSSSLPPGAAVFIQLPAAGLRIPVALDQSALLVSLPTTEGGAR